MVDGAYDVVNEMLRPGMRENDIVAEVNKFLYTHGSDDVEAVNAISGERCNPHPHNFTDRMIRPGDQAFFDILQAFMGYRTCYYRTFNVVRATPAQHDAYRKAREWLDNAIERIKPGASTAHICEVFPKAEEFGFPDEMAAFGLQFAHGLGLNLHERPIISRVVSMDHPTEIKEGMVFAIETYCAGDRRLLRRAHRGRGRGHRQGLPADLAVPGGGTADLRRSIDRRYRHHRAGSPGPCTVTGPSALGPRRRPTGISRAIGSDCMTTESATTRPAAANAAGQALWRGFRGAVRPAGKAACPRVPSRWPTAAPLRREPHHTTPTTFRIW